MGRQDCCIFLYPNLLSQAVLYDLEDVATSVSEQITHNTYALLNITRQFSQIINLFDYLA